MMNSKRLIQTLLLAVAILPAVAAKQPQVTIAPYYGGRQAALSMTFDDGLEDQYTLAFPQLRQRGLKATFAIIGSKVGGVMRSSQDRQDGKDGTRVMTWDMLRTMAADGQEISSHGWEHRAVTRLSAEALRHEVEANDSAIAANVGQRPATYVYPGNSKTPEAVAFCEQGRVGSRTFQMSLGSKRSRQALTAYLDSLIARGEWGVTMTHGIRQGYDHFTDPQVLWDFMDDVCARREQLWTATFRDVAAYRQEAANTKLKVTCKKREMTIIPVCSLSPALFSHPLTLVIDAPVASARQDGQALDIIRRGGATLTDINPHGGKIVLNTGLAVSHLTVERRLPRIRYEAETAYLSSYQELSNPLAVGTAYYAEDSLCSGGMKVVNLGLRADNDLQWRDVRCDGDGLYRVTIRCASFPSKATLIVAANGGGGQVFRAADAPDGTVTLTLPFHQGYNIVRLYNDSGPMPEIDYMEVKNL